MKPQKSDFPGYVTFTQNISDKNIDPHINDAYKFTVKPRLNTLAIDILALKPEDYASRPQLKTFYDDFVVHWWVLLSVKRFLQIHGYNLTQFGMTKIKDPQGTFEQMSPSERVVQIKQLESDADVLYTNLLNETWEFDSTVYRKPSQDCGPARSFTGGISGI